MTSYFSMDSAIKYLTTAVFTTGVGSEGNLWWNLCHFFLLLYHNNNVPYGHCICIFTNTYDLYELVVF